MQTAGHESVEDRTKYMHADNCMIEIDARGGSSIMVWDGIGLNLKSGTVVFKNLGPGSRNGVNAARYIDKVLRPHVVPHFARHQNHTFQHDNARMHTARATTDVLQQNNSTIMSWPALSPEIKPHRTSVGRYSEKMNEVHPRQTTAGELQAFFCRCGLGFL
ncbi:unnamed protein product [Mytilus coruscus]|uniref:Tc1-like transposase DDE domain-containing protein n=1 Tax=Mytilus coruscus TaxID=42192 RepID=A0A6J8CBH1_MYTCO|nr:unnamed protein product [Mytilus coruscus]